MDVRFAPADPAEPPGSTLLAAVVAELSAMYGDVEVPGMPTAAPEELRPPGGVLLVGWDGEEAVACGAVKRLDGDGLCEIKRMYVAPDARGRGLARVLLGALEDLARDLGYAIARLDTGPSQAAALALYPRAGYVDIPDYNGNPYASYWGEKRL